MKPTPCALTPTQELEWEKTRCALQWACPAFTHVFYELLTYEGSKHYALFTKDVLIAATDGDSLMLNPDTFFNYNLPERVFACAHEIMHCIWNHCGNMHTHINTGKLKFPDGTTLPYSPDLANIAMDLVINAALIEAKVGTFNKDWLHDPAVATGNDSWYDVYKKIFKKGPNGGQKGKSFDVLLSPGTSQGKDPTSAKAGRNQAQWEQTVAAGISAARVMGKLPAALDRILGDALKPGIDWREHIKALFARKVGSGSYDWRRPDRQLIVRDIYAPGRSGFGAGTIVVGGDTSGSIDYGTRSDGRQSTGDMFFGAMAEIMEDIKPKQLIIMWCDAKIQRIDYAEEASDLNTIRHKGAPGGGGTSFIPVFDEIVKLGIEPDALVYLTDGQGRFPDRAPSYPVIWGNIYPASRYPFGDVVQVPKQA